MALPTEKSVKMLLTRCGYTYKDVTAKDAVDLIAAYRDLRAGVDTCVFDDGSSKELVNLSGTIPVHYKGTIYNIPVQVWLFHTHPYQPPYCFVKPTSSMLIKEGKHVGKDGRVYLPYLHEWKAHASDLLGLVHVMLAVFGEQPPLYSRPRSISLVMAPVAGIYQNYPWYPAPNPPVEEQKKPATAAYGMTTNSSAAGSDPFHPAPKPPVEERTADALTNKRTEEELRRLQDRHTCKVCMDNEVSVVFVPCGHLVACQECASSLANCPICRAAVREAVRTFMP
ncbi:tumor susceptibility gene 101 protein-like [Lethenteron reissneri]|uniref:tumor susceptibility gene 101 protein-like n=1 Tax=Lethenteron reissneri TaxID=7753 RepID=UPI002AB6E11C|nr:tumor susceptibility gene 101 protein-like [Lethenteron reissneri]